MWYVKFLKKHEELRIRTLMQTRLISMLMWKISKVPEEYGIRINTDKSKVMRLSKRMGMVKIYGCKQLEQDNIFENVDSLFSYGKASFKKVRKLLLGKNISLNLREKFAQCYIWSTVLCGVGI